MNRITELAISFFDLVEAEGREFRLQTQKTLRSATLFFLGGLLLVAGAFMGGYALYIALKSIIGAPLAALVVALLLAAGGIILILKASSTKCVNAAHENLPAVDTKKVEDNCHGE